MVRLDDNLAPWQRLGSKFKLGLRARDAQAWLPHEDAFGDADRRAAQIAWQTTFLIRSMPRYSPPQMPITMPHAKFWQW